MASGNLHIKIDATEAVKLFMAGYEAMFIAMTDFSELKELCNLYKIGMSDDLEPLNP